MLLAPLPAVFGFGSEPSIQKLVDSTNFYSIKESVSAFFCKNSLFCWYAKKTNSWFTYL